MSRGCCCFRSILCEKNYLVPLPIHRMLLRKISDEFYEGHLTMINFTLVLFEDMASKSEKKMTQFFQVSIHLHPCHPQQRRRQEARSVPFKATF